MTAIKNNLQHNCIPGWLMNLVIHATSVWKDMSIWTRAYVYSAYAGIGSQEVIFERLYRIPADFGSTFRLIFGNEIADQYSNLLSNQIIILREIITAQINGNIDEVNQNTQRLYQNASDRAALLARINPFWNQKEWENLMRSYLGMTLDQSTRILAKDYPGEIIIFDRILFAAGLIADYFSLGLHNYIVGVNPSNSITGGNPSSNLPG